jgi:acetyl esterase/lipase
MPTPRPHLFTFGLVCALALTLSLARPARAASVTPPEALSYRTVTNLAYRTEGATDPLVEERCRLDVYHPVGADGFATVVWFHGGGLTGGTRSIPEGLQGKGFAVVGAGYRLNPGVKAPAYVEDAAAAVAWTFKHIQEFGGSPRRIFVSGHSAGGYLAMLVGLDKRWLAAHGIDANHLAGLIPYSGQCITHFTVRAERGLRDTLPVIDDLAPLHHVRKDAPPMLLISGDRNRELLGRYEENAYLWRMMKEVGNTNTELFELQGYDHGQMAEPGHPLAVRFIRSILKRP